MKSAEISKVCLVGWFALLWVAFVAQAHSAINISPVQDDGDQTIDEIVEIELADQARIEGRLCLPRSNGNAPLPALVIYVHGTGPGTYLDKPQIGDKSFNYFDLPAQEMCRQGLAFFSYNKRGVTIGDKAPWFDEVDRDKFSKVVPSVETADLEMIIDTLKQKEQLADAKIILLGWSEGTVIASMAAEKFPDKIDAILLAGYAHENMFDIIATQFTGKGSMINLLPIFDADKDGKISQDEYESEEAGVARYRQAGLQNSPFALLDANKDGFLTAEDFAMRSKPRHDYLLKSIAEGNENWIWKFYFRVSIPWLRDHFSIEPNKTRLTRLDLPIYIFHGTNDANVEVEGVHDLQRRFESLGKTNLNAFIFDEHDHDLNFLRWVMRDELSDGWAKIFDVAKQLADSQ